MDAKFLEFPISVFVPETSDDASLTVIQNTENLKEYYLSEGWKAGMVPHPLFDPKFYLAQRPDVGRAGMDPYLHYLRDGWREGVNPHPAVDQDFYFSRLPAAERYKTNPIIHYTISGYKERLSLHPLFEPNYYMSQQNDLSTTDIDPFGHYLRYGWRQGCSPHPLFDLQFYRRQRGNRHDVGTSSLVDYLTAGRAKGCSPHPLFDPKHYVAQRPDIANADIDPLSHYARYGWQEGTTPSRLFHNDFYAIQASDMTLSDANLLVHYLTQGWKVGLSPHPLFDPKYYLSLRPDVAEAGLHPFLHYLQHGWREGANPHPVVDQEFYFSQQSSPEQSRVSPIDHYLAEGYKDRRSLHPLFDPQHYVAQRPNIDWSAVDPLSHYLMSGWREGLSPHPLVDQDFYRQQSSGDSYGADSSPLANYLVAGRKEGRSLHPLFDPEFYLGQRPDIVEADIDPLTHYVRFGWREGTPPSHLFDLQFYGSQAPSPSLSNTIPLSHYVTVGWKEGLSPHPMFDPSYYRAQLPNLQYEPIDLLTHYVRFGWADGMKPHPLFDPEFYQPSGAENSSMSSNPLEHYLSKGWKDGLSAHPMFDVEFYRSQLTRELSCADILDYLRNQSADGAKPCPAIDENWYRSSYHYTGATPVIIEYLTNGWKYNHAPHPLFDVALYLKQVSNCEEPALLHYLKKGEHSGARPNEMFSPFYFKTRYKNFVSETASPFMHYLKMKDPIEWDSSPEFRMKRYASRFMSYGSQQLSPLNHFMFFGRWTGFRLPDSTDRTGFNPTKQIEARRKTGGSAPDGKADLAVIIGMADPSIEPIRAWAMGEAAEHVVRCSGEEAVSVLRQALAEGRAKESVLLLAGGALMADVDIRRLVSRLSDAALSMPAILDRNLDIVHAGYEIEGKFATPRGVGGDPDEPDLCVPRKGLITAGPVVAVRSNVLRKALEHMPDACGPDDLMTAISSAAFKEPEGTQYWPTSQAYVISASNDPARPWRISADLETDVLKPIKRSALVIDSIVPRTGFDAGSNYILQIVEMYQSAGFEVTFLPDAELNADRQLIYPLIERNIKLIQAPFVLNSEAYIDGTKDEFDVVIMSRVVCGGRHFERIKERWPKSKCVFHPGDLHYLREMREAVILEALETFSHAIATKARELELVEKADVTVVVSDHEFEVLGKAGLKDKIRRVAPEYTNRPPAPYVASERKGVAFIGGYGHTPNVDAVEYLIQDIWPKIASERDDIELLLVGSNAPASFKTYESRYVRLIGFVEDLDSFLDGLKLTIAPLRFGAGVKMKLISSLAAGVPVICSEVAVEGTGMRTGDGIVVADTAERIAETIMRYYDDDAELQKLSERGLKNVRKTNSPEAVRGRYFEDVIRGLNLSR